MSMNNFCPVISSSFLYLFLFASFFVYQGDSFVIGFPFYFPPRGSQKTGREGIFDIPQERVVFLGVSIYKFAFFGYRFFFFFKKSPLIFVG